MYNYQKLSEQISDFLLKAEYQSRKSDVRRAAIRLQNIDVNVISKFDRNPKAIAKGGQNPKELIAFARLLSEVFPLSFKFNAAEYGEETVAGPFQHQDSLTERFECVQFKAPRQYAVTLSVEQISQLYRSGKLIPEVWFKKNGVVYGCEDLAPFMPLNLKQCEAISRIMRDGAYYYDALSFVLLSEEGNIFYDDAEKVLTWDGTFIVPDGYHRVKACVKAMMMASEDEKAKFRDCCFSVTIYYLTTEELRRLINQFHSGTFGNPSLRLNTKGGIEFNVCTYLRDPANGLNQSFAKNISASYDLGTVLQPKDIIDAFSTVYPDTDPEKMIVNCQWLIEFLNAFTEIFPEDVKNIHKSIKKKVLFRRITTVWLIVFSKELREKINAGECKDWKLTLRSMLDISWEIQDNRISKEFYTLNKITRMIYSLSKDFFDKRWNEVMEDVR